MSDYEFHELADLFPLMEKEELEELAQDIKKNGLLEEIILYDKKILDGRNRYLACQIAKVEPRFRIFSNKIDPLDYIISMNLERRHLTKDQIAIITVEKILPLIEEKARKRQLEGKKIEEDLMHDIIPKVKKGKSRKIAAGKMKVGENKIQKAKKITEVAKNDPKIKEKLNEIKKGRARIDNVYQQIKKNEKPKIIPKLPKEKYNIIYADPPWQYNFTESPTRSIEKEYPTMELSEIKKLKIPSADNSILFLWCPAPKLYPEGMEVIKAWGFIYKTCMVWVKDRIGMGYYARNRHELLLVATKGSPGVPEPSNRPDSVIEAPRTEHSKKPEIMYELIEQMYPHGKYLELFARNKRGNWKSWGNEI